MPLLRKTGVRSPFLPGPPQAANTDPLRQTIVIAAIVPAVLLGGNAQVVGQLPRPEDTSNPPRGAVVVQQPVPVPGAQTWMPLAPRDAGAPPPDRLSPTTLIGGQQPIPGPSFWAPSPARDPNVDPLRPPLVVADPPDATLAQPSAIWVGRLPRNEDVNWPARPALVQGVPVPIPGAQAWLPAPPRPANADPLRPVLLQADPPDATLAQPQMTWLGRLPRDEDTTRPARPALVSGPSVPLPGAVVAQTYAPRDTPPAQPDRIAPAAIIAGQQPLPAAQLVTIGRITSTPTDHLAPPIVLAGQQPTPAGLVLATYAPRDQPAQPDRLSPPQLTAGQMPIPGAGVAWVGMPKQAPDRLAPMQVVAGWQPQPLGQALRIGRITSTPQERVPWRGPVLVQASGLPPPSAVVLLLRAVRDGTAPIVIGPGHIETPPYRVRALAPGMQRVWVLPARDRDFSEDTP